jgi:hypothetical protein
MQHLGVSSALNSTIADMRDNSNGLNVIDIIEKNLVLFPVSFENLIDDLGASSDCTQSGRNCPEVEEDLNLTKDITNHNVITFL